ncbi:hypothetical protein SAMN05421882_100248 [Nitrosomonas communis]|uniref:Uncharacterized protein n=1 Tax=Nitrosomonas communis TaxID=44574 RepID=A0A1H2QE57_9PROT|nr:hypothetical protein SAMN05421882_100248 [Nitrosomonas communis]
MSELNFLSGCPVIGNHISADIDCKQADGEQSLSDQGADRVDTTLRMPVMGTMTSLASRCITVRARRIKCKATFINLAYDLYLIGKYKSDINHYSDFSSEIGASRVST